MKLKELFIGYFGEFEQCTDYAKWTKKENEFKLYLVKDEFGTEIIDGKCEDYSMNLKLEDFDDEMNLLEENAFQSKTTLDKIQSIKKILGILELQKEISKDTEYLKTSKPIIRKF